jgi:predicted AlkP superfamily phosphohydrolase/phosphomutase/tetratricopeptide (TPR) repeat protein
MPARDPQRKILLIGWDGADWEHIDPLLEAGLLPTLDHFINQGVMGNLATLQPILSPMLWNSVATGKFADKHGIHGFVEPNPSGEGVRPYSSTSRKVKALWNIFTQEGMRSNVVGWWASHPAEPIDGTIVTNSFNGTKFHPQKGWQWAPGTFHPAEKASHLAQFRVLPHELTHEHILPFIPEGGRIDQEKDRLLQSFGKVLSDCASTHAVATTIMEEEPWDFTAVYYDAIDHFCHAFMQFHPPRMPRVPDEQFEIYREVIRGAYRFHDMMLERLLQLAGPETTVILCSDHGFQSRGLRPKGMPREPAGPAIWHREYGILVMRGPGLKRDERIYGASLIDIAPTILTLFGLPVGEDMDGRTLSEAFQQPPDVQWISSWEEVPGECGMHDGEPEMTPGESEALLQQFVALGYIEDPGDDKQKAAENADIECKYNLARTLLWTGRADDARPLLEEIVRGRSWEDRFWSLLTHCYFQGGYYRQAEKLLTELYRPLARMLPPAKLLLGRIKQEMGELLAALDLFHEAEEAEPRLPSLHTQLGACYLKLRRFDDAERAFKKALAIHEDTATAYLGLSTVYRRQGRNQETADAALAAVGLIHRLPVAHFNLGVAMARSGAPERAVLAFETALKFRPEMVDAHRWLAAVYRQELNDLEKARIHQDLARQSRSRHDQQSTAKWKRMFATFELPPIPSADQREKNLNQERPLPKQEPDEKSGRTFVLVSGLPRSGTSLMMQILQAGGMQLMTDGQRVADQDNPKGYYEWEALKQIGKRPELLDDEGLDKKAIKAISMLLPKLPKNHNYKILFMTRPIEEVVASQAKMLDRKGAEGAKLDHGQLTRQLETHRNRALKWLQQNDHTDVLEVDYPALVRAPEQFVPKIVEFVGEDRLAHSESMVAVIDSNLYRQKAAPADSQ